MKPNQQTAVFVLIAVLTTAAIGIGVTYVMLAPGSTAETDSLTISHWWTSAGEAAAINDLIAEYKSLYPNTTVYSAAIAGGGGFSLRVVLKTQILAGDIPDTFQVHAGYEWKEFYDANLLERVDHIWTTELQAAVPDVVEEINKGPDGHYYSVPVNIHRANVLWVNKDLWETQAASAGITYTLDQINNNWTIFREVLYELDADGNTEPLALGFDWTQAHLFEQVLAGLGIDAYEAWVNGEIDSATATHYPDLLEAAEICANLSYYTTGKDQEWNEAIADVISNVSTSSVFSIMGDWAAGEFIAISQNLGEHYEAIASPGTENMYGLVVDCFESPKGNKHPTNVDRWLETVASIDGQDAFNLQKGSIPARTDTTATYNDYQNSAMADFAAIEASGSSYMFPSVIHGSGAPEKFVNDLVPQVELIFTTPASYATYATAIAALAATYSAEFTRTWVLD